MTGTLFDVAPLERPARAPRVDVVLPAPRRPDPVDDRPQQAAARAAGVPHLTDWTRDRRPDGDPARRVAFYLGCHQPRWLETAPVPLFIAAQRLAAYRRRGEDMPRPYTPYAIDSGGFTELSKHGMWTLSEDEYGGMITRFMLDMGPPRFVAPQDWMCEPWIVAKTGLSVEIHQELTVENYLYLTREFPHVPWIPVLQGWQLADYARHVEAYAAAGIDLADEPLVGLGSVCRREATAEIGAIVTALHGMGIRMHGFGVKRAGFTRYGHLLESADSLAWSFGARRRQIRLPDCTHAAEDCRNCLTYALTWRETTLNGLRHPKGAEDPHQTALRLDATA
ncbi:hypothetical protein ABN028_19490 [Actinopolymorpha sp. B17G11]|uniref:deazapurine DNA modification protein DpdA family protein n=1 Tax=Actinopolymorpha sp. B17G11 TaxID=3160861 RepID=UPI0032E4BA75